MKRWGVFVAILAVLLVSAALPFSASAQQQSTPTRTLQISPLHTFIDITPGASYAGSVQLKNTGTETLSVSLSAEAFDVSNEEYDYIFLPDSPVNKWVRFLTPELSLKPNQTYDAKFLISVPIEAEPGGAYISIFAASLPTEESSIQSTDRVGSLFYINLAGDTTQKGELIKFSAPWINSSDATSWSATLRNAGSTHFISKYEISLLSLWSQRISSDSGEHLILPQSVRLVSGSIQNPDWIGIYKIVYSFELGDNTSASGTQLFFYAPLAQLIPLVALLTGLSVLIVRIYRRKKS